MSIIYFNLIAVTSFIIGFFLGRLQRKAINKRWIHQRDESWVGAPNYAMRIDPLPTVNPSALKKKKEAPLPLGINPVVEETPFSFDFPTAEVTPPPELLRIPELLHGGTFSGAGASGNWDTDETVIKSIHHEVQAFDNSHSHSHDTSQSSHSFDSPSSDNSSSDSGGSDSGSSSSSDSGSSDSK